MKTIISVEATEDGIKVVSEGNDETLYPHGHYLSVLRLVNCCYTSGTVSVECLIVGDKIITDDVEGRQAC